MVFIGMVAGPVQGAIYTDVLTVTTTGLFNPTPAGNDLSLNRLGLDLVNFNESFTLQLQYDSDTAFFGTFGTFAFGSLSPNNVMSLTFSGALGSVTFNETQDVWYDYLAPFLPPPIQDRGQGPQAFFTPSGSFNAASSMWAQVEFSGTTTYADLDEVRLFLGASENTLSFQKGSSPGLYVSLDVDYAGFDPLTDRTAVPIPGTLLLLAPGLVGLLGIRRRFAKS
jgi:hypothetical protein